MDRRTFLTASAALPLAGAATLAQPCFAAPAVVKGDKPPLQLNEAIQKARQAALDVLQPTPQQLQHGLELHAASLVFESYGFSPRSSIDPDVLAKAAESGATQVELGDLREEMGMTRCVTDPEQQAEYKLGWEAAGVTCILQNAGEEIQAPLRLLRRLARFSYVCDMLRDFVFKAATPDDIVAAKKQGRHCLYMSGNGVPLAQDWMSVEGEMAFIRVFFQLGIRMMHMTYNRRNMLGDGCGEPANGGLSDFGRSVVGEMNRVGVIPDVAHSGWQTSLETAQVSKKPAVASHSACDALNHHCRCKPDNVIKALCDSGGYIGICSIASFLGGKGDISSMLDHIDYAVKRFGPDRVAIGTDVAYSSQVATKSTAKVPKSGPSRARWEKLWPPDAFKGPAQHPSLAWVNWPMFTVGMVQRGYRDEDIQKILGGNVLRVCRATLDATP